MYLVEYILYFGEIVWYFVILFNFVVMLFNSYMVGFGVINGYIGFDKFEIIDEIVFDSYVYMYYLYYKYFEVNYGVDGFVFFDKWFGYWYDGLKEVDE